MESLTAVGYAPRVEYQGLATRLLVPCHWLCVRAVTGFHGIVGESSRWIARCPADALRIQSYYHGNDMRSMYSDRLPGIEMPSRSRRH